VGGTDCNRIVNTEDLKGGSYSGVSKGRIKAVPARKERRKVRESKRTKRHLGKDGREGDFAIILQSVKGVSCRLGRKESGGVLFTLKKLP